MLTSIKPAAVLLFYQPYRLDRSSPTAQRYQHGNIVYSLF